MRHQLKKLHLQAMPLHQANNHQEDTRLKDTHLKGNLLEDSLLKDTHLKGNNLPEDSLLLKDNHTRSLALREATFLTRSEESWREPTSPCVKMMTVINERT